MLLKIFVYILVDIAFFTCKNQELRYEQQQVAKSNIRATKQEIIKLDSSQVNQCIIQHIARPFQNEMLQFYRRNDFKSVWFTHKNHQELSWLNYALSHFYEEGLNKKFELWPRFNYLLKHHESQTDSVELEVSATSLYLEYALSCWNGMLKSNIRSTGWNKTARYLSQAELLAHLDNIDSVFVNPPVFFQYKLLKQSLKKYLEIQKMGSLPWIPEQKKYPSWGDTSLVIQQMTHYFKRTGSLQDVAHTIYDSSFYKAVKSIQVQFGLTANGIINRELVRQMNVSLESRIDQIRVNMERCRWIRPDTSSLFLVVNIPDFSYYLIQHQKRIWVKKVIVGKTYQPTAIFNGVIQSVVICPYWHIPPGILKQEIIPAIRRNPNYLKIHDMEWYGHEIRQRPGPTNPLGSIKFLFPNSFNMYLHDTPGKELFSHYDRAFSHGCMRIENALELAEFLLHHDGGWTIDKIMRVIKQGKETYIVLKNQVPIHITYLTAWVDESGFLQLRNDVYGYDAQLLFYLNNSR